jgi:catechol 2,3-dioxygenase-like lactoylglutathione lyase family enzyme
VKIGLTSILVDDQEKALRFYTEKLGFTLKTDIPTGEYRWLTVTSPEGVEGVELLLEPMGFEASRVYQKALRDAGIPLTTFFTNDIDGECAKLRARGVLFTVEPTRASWGAHAVFDDTVGNLINLAEVP